VTLPTGVASARWGERGADRMPRVIRIFSQTSMALYAYFRLAELLGLPREVTHIKPSKSDGDPVVSVGYNLGVGTPYVMAIFRFSLNIHSNSPMYVLRGVRLYGTFKGPMSEDGEWVREFTVDFPNSPEIPEFAPPLLITEEFFRLSEEARRRLILEYFRTGK